MENVNIKSDKNINKINIRNFLKIRRDLSEGRLWLNPGSCGKRRFGQDITLAVLRIEAGTCSVERIDIDHEAAGKKAAPE